MGFVASNEIRGLVAFSELVPEKDAVLLDIREKPELLADEIPNAINIPLSELWDSLNELDKNIKYVTFCALGLRGYIASRILTQNGFSHVMVYPSGTKMFRALHSDGADSMQNDTIEKVSGMAKNTDTETLWETSVNRMSALLRFAKEQELCILRFTYND